MSTKLTDEVENVNKHNNSRMTLNSQRLRKNMTKEERRLWYDFLKKLPQTINRQKVFDNYIVDFYCAKAKLVIELDGSQHYEEKGLLKDLERQKYFNARGIKVIHYSNYDVNTNFEGVCLDILRHLNLPSP